jgi:hypothetical protein
MKKKTTKYTEPKISKKKLHPALFARNRAMSGFDSISGNLLACEVPGGSCGSCAGSCWWEGC